MKNGIKKPIIDNTTNKRKRLPTKQANIVFSLNQETSISECVVEGVKTIIPFHLKILNDLDYKNGNFNTNYINILTQKTKETVDASR